MKYLGQGISDLHNSSLKCLNLDFVENELGSNPENIRELG